jgi:hypothetical protein
MCLEILRMMYIFNVQSGNTGEDEDDEPSSKKRAWYGTEWFYARVRKTIGWVDMIIEH